MYRKKLAVILLFLFAPLCVWASEIAVVSVAAGDAYRDSVALGIKNKQEYCDQHGYDFICASETLDATRPASWSKVLLILEVMKNKKYKWIFWTDADALIMNTGIRLENFIDDQYNFIINHDCNGFNAGHFLIKNCERSENFLRETYAREEFIYDPVWEQAAMLAILQERGGYLAMTKVIPQRIMNSFPKASGNLLHGTYQTGDFVLHFAGTGNPEILKALLDYYYPKARDYRENLTYEHYLGIHGIKGPPKFPSSVMDHSVEIKNKWRANWLTEEQRKSYAEALATRPEIRDVAIFNLSSGEIAETFFKELSSLETLVAYPRVKRYNPFARAACDYFSAKYPLKWKEFQGSPKNLTVLEKPFDLIFFETSVLEELVEVAKWASTDTQLWINNYQMPIVQKMVEQAITMGLLEIVTIHEMASGHDYRSWIEARYLPQANKSIQEEGEI